MLSSYAEAMAMKGSLKTIQGMLVTYILHLCMSPNPALPADLCHLQIFD
jgi:hypothetical protein